MNVLKNLISPSSVEDFFAKHWPKNPFLVHGLKVTVQPLTQLAFLQSLDSLLNTWQGPIQVHLPDVSDESSSVDCFAKDARKLFANGMALLFNNAQTLSTELQNWIETLRGELGLPRSTISRCMVYATPDGKGTAVHFDQNVNFVLQLHGTKKWWLSENTSVQNPTQRHTIGQPLDPELASYSDTEMPTVLSGARKEYILKPGSLLFVPRGYWHSTEAEGEALALNFTFSQPTWVDLFTMALRSRLALSPDWRELADGVTSQDPARRQFAEKYFDVLLTELIDDLPNWRAADILGATEGV